MWIFIFSPDTFSLSAAGMRKCIKTSLDNANKAVKYLSKIDEIISPELPLTWMFIRPPWAYPGGMRKCLKECMLIKLEEKCKSEEVKKDFVLEFHDVDVMFSVIS